jgi:hypothetical protein
MKIAILLIGRISCIEEDFYPLIERQCKKYPDDTYDVFISLSKESYVKPAYPECVKKVTIGGYPNFNIENTYSEHGIRTETSKMSTQIHMYNLKHCFNLLENRYDCVIVTRSEIQSDYLPDFHHELNVDSIYVPDYGFCGTNGGFTCSLIYYGTQSTIQKMATCFDNLKIYGDVDKIRFAMEDCYAYHAMKNDIHVNKIQYDFKINPNRINIRDLFDSNLYITSTTLKKYSDFYLDPFAYNNDRDFVGVVNTCDFNDKIVYVHGDFIELLLLKLQQCKNMTIIIHGTYRIIDDIIINSLLPHASKIYAINCPVIHPKVFNIPLGFQDANTRDNKKRFNIMDFQVDTTKTKLLLQWDENYNYSDLAKYKFSMCPGLDTYIFYESSLLGTRPIVLSSPLDNMYRKFNPLIVNDWSDVTQELLDSQSEYEIPFEAFKLKYWISEV